MDCPALLYWTRGNARWGEIPDASYNPVGFLLIHNTLVINSNSLHGSTSLVLHLVIWEGNVQEERPGREKCQGVNCPEPAKIGAAQLLYDTCCAAIELRGGLDVKSKRYISSPDVAS